MSTLNALGKYERRIPLAIVVIGAIWIGSCNTTAKGLVRRLRSINSSGSMSIDVDQLTGEFIICTTSDAGVSKIKTSSRTYSADTHTALPTTVKTSDLIYVLREASNGSIALHTLSESGTYSQISFPEKGSWDTSYSLSESGDLAYLFRSSERRWTSLGSSARSQYRLIELNLAKGTERPLRENVYAFGLLCKRSARENRLYYLARENGGRGVTLLELDLQNNRLRHLTDEVTLGKDINDYAVSPDGQSVYISSAHFPSSIFSINARSLAVSHIVSVDFATELLADGTNLYFVRSMNSARTFQIYRFDLKSRTLDAVEGTLSGVPW